MTIPVYNVNNTLNKVNQISEVVNVVLHYKIHAKQILLTISSLENKILSLGLSSLNNTV